MSASIQVLFRRPVIALVLAGLLVTAVSALRAAAPAHAATAPMQLFNAVHNDRALEVAADGTVGLRPSNPASFRQKWAWEPVGDGRNRWRNLATNSCLIAPSAVSSTAVLRVGPCGGVGNRNLWLSRNVVVGNGAGMPVSVQTGQAPLTKLSGPLPLVPEQQAAQLGALSEYKGM